MKAFISFTVTSPKSWNATLSRLTKLILVSSFFLDDLVDGSVKFFIGLQLSQLLPTWLLRKEAPGCPVQGLPAWWCQWHGSGPMPSLSSAIASLGASIVLSLAGHMEWYELHLSHILPRVICGPDQRMEADELPSPRREHGLQHWKSLLRFEGLGQRKVLSVCCCHVQQN